VYQTTDSDTRSSETPKTKMQPSCSVTTETRKPNTKPSALEIKALETAVGANKEPTKCFPPHATPASTQSTNTCVYHQGHINAQGVADCKWLDKSCTSRSSRSTVSFKQGRRGPRFWRQMTWWGIFYVFIATQKILCQTNRPYDLMNSSRCGYDSSRSGA
jgi:hypothetical protein